MHLMEALPVLGLGLAYSDLLVTRKWKVQQSSRAYIM